MFRVPCSAVVFTGWLYIYHVAYFDVVNYFSVQNMVGGKWRSDSPMGSGEFKDIDKLVPFYI